MLLFFIVPLVIAALKKYSLAPAFKAWDLYPLFAVEALHLFFQANAYFGEFRYVRYATALQYAFLLVLLLPILRRKLYKQAMIGSVCVCFGTLMNKIVIHANGGKMPVYPTLSRLTGFYKEGSLSGGVDSLHVMMTAQTQLNFLGDYVDLGFSILSFGDLFIHGFVSLVLYATIVALNQPKTDDDAKVLHAAK